MPLQRTYTTPYTIHEPRRNSQTKKIVRGTGTLRADTKNVALKLLM